MGWLTKWSFANKAAVGLLVVMALVVGGISYTTLPMEFMPEADNPQVSVMVMGPGQNAGSMENKVTKPIESAVGLVKGKKEILSTSGEGYSKIDIYYDSKTNMKEASQEVQKAVDQLQFPEGVMKPFVLQLNTSMIPISEVTISFDDGLTDSNMEIMETTILHDLQNIKGVSNVGIYGRPTSQINVSADQSKMAQKGVSFTQFMSVLQGRNVSASVGAQTIGGQSGNVNVISKIDSIDTLKKLPIMAGVTLEDIAKIELKQDSESVTRANGKDVLFAVVTKEANANAVDVGNKVQEVVNDINNNVKNANVDVIMSTSDMVVDSVNSMMREVLMGALFATIIILLFLRNIRATLVTVISIPLSIAVTLYLLKVSGVTLNIITLGGVAVAVGRLVDDSIVVIENIYRRMQKEPLSVEMVIHATKEVAQAITSSTIATVAVFLPMGLLNGGLQAFLLPFALTITYSLLTSLVVALTVVPLLSSWLLKGSRLKEDKPSKQFGSFLHWNLRHKWVTLSLSLFIFVASIGAYVYMPKGALDASDAGMVLVKLKYPNDVPVKQVLENGKKLEEFMIKQDQADTVILQYGNSAEMAQLGSVSSLAEVSYTVMMKENADAQLFMEQVRAQKQNYDGATVTVNEGSMMGSASTTEYVDIVGDDITAISTIAKEVKTKLQSVDGVEKVFSSGDDTKPVFAFNVDPLAANGQEIAMQVSAMLNPMPIGQIEIDNVSTAVVLEPSVQPKTEQDLSGMMLMTAGGPVPLSKLAKLEVRNEPAMIYHKEGKNYLRITAEIDPKLVSKVGANIQKEIDTIKVPDGVTVIAGGASVDQSDEFADLGMTALISIGLVYLIMVLTFKTLRAPLAIMFSLPLAAIGAILGLLVSGVTPDFTAMFGALMLIGIVVTNAIVLIDRIKHNEQYMTVREAIIEAALTRMRPILMTAIATICAMLPLVFGHSEEGSIVSQSLAIVVIGGLTAATVLTLIVIPVIYELFYFRKSSKQRKGKIDSATHSVSSL
ncbi:multidrug transporter AcrB [Paenibacillus macquariensis subsp. defensor]|nr:multidrug transporter AcrB [Paenibacillus macquariensis subsp. defensor]